MSHRTKGTPVVDGGRVADMLEETARMVVKKSIYLFLIFPSWKHNLRKINGNGLEPQLVMLKIAVRWARKGNRCKVSDLPCSSLMLKWDHHVLKFSKNQNSQTWTRCKPSRNMSSSHQQIDTTELKRNFLQISCQCPLLVVWRMILYNLKTVI